MRHYAIALLLLAFISSTNAQTPPENGFCIKNAANITAIFAVDAGEPYRLVQELRPDARLCTPNFDTPVDGFVSVFLSFEAIEGCSRLTKAGSTAVLNEYHDFDRCKWQTLP